MQNYGGGELEIIISTVIITVAVAMEIYMWHSC